MTDIVERLRQPRPQFYESLLLEAADEIERLRALLKGASYHVENVGDVSLLTDIRRALEGK